MYDERFTELVKVAVEKLKEDTVFQMMVCYTGMAILSVMTVLMVVML